MDLNDTTKFIPELEAGLAIDKHELDAELVEHAERLYHTGQLQVAWTKRRDQLKLQLQRLEASLDATLRRDAAVAGEKITEKEIARAIDLDKSVVKVQDEMLECSTQVDQLAKLWDSYKARKDTLRGLVDLYTSNYYSDPSAGTSAKSRVAAEARQHLAVERKRLKR